MADSAGYPRNEVLIQFVHDVKHILHMAGLGMEILKSVRDDDARFAEICAVVEREHRESLRLLNEYLVQREGCE